jgi:SpoIVB peptidase S55
VFIVSIIKRSVQHTRRAVLVGICLSGLLVSVLVATTPAPAATPCTSPPATFPVAQMHPGMTGVGYTVIKGTTVEPFDVEVLGVLPDYIFLGVDIIVMKMTGPADLVETTGGAVAGMSGSPVYLNGQLAGALAWAIAEDRHIFGVTAAEDMVGIFNLEDAGGTTAMPSRIVLPPELIRTARASGSMLTDTAALESLPVPLGVSGLSGIPLSDIEATFADHGMNVTAFRSGSVKAPSAVTIDPTHFVPGDGLGIALSYGDVSYYGFGTTTAVCGDVALGFGHPAFWGQGEISLGMTDVEIFAIDNGTFWGRKIGTIGDTHGVLTQDRFAGVAGVFGLTPTLVPITSDVSSPDTGLSRQGETDAAWDEDWFVADAAWYHAYSNFTYVQQANAPGTVDFRFTINGTREDGSAFTVSNRWLEANDYGAAYGVSRMAEMMYALVYNNFEPIDFTDVDLTGTITGEDLTSRIATIKVSSPLQPQLRARNVVRARPGDTLTFEVTLDRVEADTSTTATVKLKVPRWARGFDRISFAGGRGRLDVYDRDVGSFEQLLSRLNGGDHLNDLIVRGLGRKILQAQDVEVTGKGSVTVKVVR